MPCDSARDVPGRPVCLTCGSEPRTMNRILNAVLMIWNIIRQKIRHWSLRREGIVILPTTVIRGKSSIDGKVRIGAKTIVQSSFLDGRGGVTVGAHVLLDQCTVLSAQHDFDDPAYPTTYAAVVIEDYVIIYKGALVLPGRRIGRGAIVAAHSVVTKDVPDMAVVGGNPARVLRQRQSVHDQCDLTAMAGLNLLDKIKQHSR